MYLSFRQKLYLLTIIINGLGPNPAKPLNKKGECTIHLAAPLFYLFLVRPAGFEPAAYGFEDQK